MKTKPQMKDLRHGSLHKTRVPRLAIKSLVHLFGMKNEISHFKKIPMDSPGSQLFNDKLGSKIC